MTQDSNNKNHYIADEGMCFRRINNGFTPIENSYIVGEELFLGQILVDQNGKELSSPINDHIEYYEEVEAPKPEKSEK